jgi:undecaprenyl-diphosphatase
MEYAVLGGLAVFMFEERRVSWVKVRFVGVIVLLAGIVRFGLKPFIVNALPLARPYVLLHDVVLLAAPQAGEEYESFPSGHALFFFALATAMYMHNKKAGTLLYVAATLMAFGRVATGLHYTTDILAGAVLGSCIAYGTVKLAHRYVPKKWLEFVHNSQK